MPCTDGFNKCLFMSFPADDRYPGRTTLPHRRENPVLIMPVFRSPAGSRTGQDRIRSPAQYHDQLQCPRIVPPPGIPMATDGNQPHTRICLSPPDGETGSYSGKTRSYWGRLSCSRSRLPTTTSRPEKCPFGFFPAGDRLPGRTVVPVMG